MLSYNKKEKEECPAVIDRLSLKDFKEAEPLYIFDEPEPDTLHHKTVFYYCPCGRGVITEHYAARPMRSVSSHRVEIVCPDCDNRFDVVFPGATNVTRWELHLKDD